jgi:transposase
MPPAYVKPYVKRQKNDTKDADTICEAVTRPNMRFVPPKTVEQQSCLMFHRARHLFIRQQTAVINSIRAYIAEFGIVAPVGWALDTLNQGQMTGDVARGAWLHHPCCGTRSMRRDGVELRLRVEEDAETVFHVADQEGTVKHEHKREHEVLNGH